MSARPYDSGHDIARDVEDIDAVLAETGADRVFGLSSGAVITLEAARTLPRVTRAAVYEPPFYPAGISQEGVRRLHTEIDRGDLSSALVSALLVAETAPPVMRVLPRPAVRLLAGVVLAVDGHRPGRYARLRDLLPGIRYDFTVVASMDGKINIFASVEKPVLLISGTRSAPFLRRAVRRLEQILPRAHHVEFDGLDHSSSWNTDRGGRPDVVAAALQEFFA